MRTEEIISILMKLDEKKSEDNFEIKDVIEKFVNDESYIDMKTLVKRNYSLACLFAEELYNYFETKHADDESRMTVVMFSLASSDEVNESYFRRILRVLYSLRNEALSLTLLSVISQGALHNMKPGNFFIRPIELKNVDDQTFFNFFAKHLINPNMAMLEDLSREGLNSENFIRILKNPPFRESIVPLLEQAGREVYKSDSLQRTEPIVFLKFLQGKSFKEEFDELYNENKDKLFVQKTYPLNETNVQKWIKLQPTKDARLCATLFRTYTQHISFNQFKETLYKVCYDAVGKIRSEGFEKVILICGQNMIKSEIWVALLSWSILKDYVTDVVPDIDYLDQILLLHTEKKTLVINCDDCAYSGTQLYDALTQVKISQKFAKRSNVSCFVLVPYVSRKAELHIQKLGDTTMKNFLTYFISDQSERFDSFKENLKKHDNHCFPLQSINFRDKHTIYFDHKLADDFSIYDKFYLEASDLLNETNFGFSLIENCNYAKISSEFETYTPIENRCPPAFYKYIEYTYRGFSIKEELKINPKLSFLYFLKF